MHQSCWRVGNSSSAEPPGRNAAPLQYRQQPGDCQRGDRCAGLWNAEDRDEKRRPEQCAQALMAAGTGAVALKLGKDGCLIGSDQGLLRVPGFSVQARDTTGAGDYFAAGLIAGFLGGLDWHDAAVLGNAMGALAAARVGAGTSVPGAGEVLDFLRLHQESSPWERADPSTPRAESIQQVIDFLVTLTTERKER